MVLILGFTDNNGSFLNKAAKYIQRHHLVAGMEHLLMQSSRITVEGFAKLYKHYPVSVIDNVSLANKG